MKTKEIYLTPQEVASTLKLNLLTIYGYIRTKQVKAVKFGRKYRIAQEDLDKFITDHRTC